MSRKPESQIAAAMRKASNPDAEEAVLGGIFFRNDLLPQLEFLGPDDFCDPRHQAVFMAIRNLEITLGSDEAKIDAITVEAELQRLGKLDAVGGLAFLASIACRVPTPDNAIEYAKIVHQNHITRQVIRASGHTVDLLAEGGIVGEEAVEVAFNAIQRIEVGAISDRANTMGSYVDQAMRQFMADLAAKDAGEKFMPGMPTGISALDRRMGGVPFSVLSMVGARPAAGKTTFAMKLVAAAKSLGDDDPLVFTYEDSGISFAHRQLAQASGVPTHRIISRDVDRHEMTRLHRAAESLRTSPDSLVMAAGMSVEDLARNVRAYRRRRSGRAGLSRTRGRLIVVDYLQKMPINPEFRGKRNEGIGHITRSLSWLAQEESQRSGDEIAVVALSQIGREVDKRDDPTPQLSDFKDSGDIEQDCKMAIGLIYWHGYNKDRDPRLLEAHILKNHNGPSAGVVQLDWDRETHTISDSAGEVAISRRRAAWGAPVGARYED
jgi:replicative DNA helicase